MSKEPVSVTEAEPEFGPKMLALTEKQRAFVVAMYDEEAPLKGDGLLVWAVKQAGYNVANNKNASNVANKLVHDDRVLAAISEHSKRLVRAISPEALRAVRNAIADPKSRDHLRAVALVLDRTDPIETKHTVQIEDNRPPPVEATEKVLARIEELMQRAGMLPKPGQIIDGECKVVE